MHARRYVRIALTATATATMAACAFLNKHPVGQVGPEKSRATTRWDATLSTPSGATGTRGAAALVAMGPNQSWAVVSITNAAPHGARAWHVYQGQCGDDGAAVGPASAYPLLKVDRDGDAASTALLPLGVPTSGAYYIIVNAAAATTQTAAACGNLALRTAG